MKRKLFTVPNCTDPVTSPDVTKGTSQTNIPNEQIAVMLTLMSDSDSKLSIYQEAKARVEAYARQIIQLAGVDPDQHFVNWDNKTIVKRPPVITP